jgi:hypothetical protein
VEVDSYPGVDPKFVEFVRYDEEYDDVILDATCAYLVKAAK